MAVANLARDQFSQFNMNLGTLKINSDKKHPLNESLIVVGNSLFEGGLSFSSTSNSTSTSTGALVLDGGMGIKQDLYVGGKIYGDVEGDILDHYLTLDGTVDTSSTSTGTLIVNGGTGIAKKLYLGDTSDISVSTLPRTGALIANGGISSAKSIVAGYKYPFIAECESSDDPRIQGRYMSRYNLAGAPCSGITFNWNCDQAGVKNYDNGNYRSTGLLLANQGMYLYNTELFTAGGAYVNPIQLFKVIRPTDSTCVMYLYSNTTNYSTFSSSAVGDLTIDSTGNDINFHSTDSIHVLNTTIATDSLTGALIVSGGTNCLGDVRLQNTKEIILNSNHATMKGRISSKYQYPLGSNYALNLSYNYNGSTYDNDARSYIMTLNTEGCNIWGSPTYTAGSVWSTPSYLWKVGYESDNTSRMTLYSNGSYTESGYIECSSTGDMTINCSGNDLNFHSTDSIHVLNTIDASSTSTGAFQVLGGAGIAKKLYVGGNLSSNTHTIMSPNGLLSGSVSVLDGVGDLILNPSAGSVVRSNTQLWALSTSGSQVIAGYDAVNYGYLSTNSSGNMRIQSSGSNISIGSVNAFQVLNTVNATSTSTGALTVDGGVGVAKDLYANRLFSNVDVTSPTVNVTQQLNIKYDSTHYVTCGSDSAGSLEIVPLGGQVKDLATVQATSTSTGALTVAGGVGIAKNIYIGGDTSITGKLLFAIGTITIGAGAGPFNNVVLGDYTLFNISNASNNGSAITGFTGGINGRRVYISYTSYPSAGNTLSIDNDSASSDAANRILTPTGVSINLSANNTGSIGMIYNGTISRWVITNVEP